MKVKKDIHVYLPQEVYDALKKLAESNRRSLSAEVVLAVENRIKQGRVKRGE